MSERLAAGDAVQTPYGKGVVLEVRSNGRLLVQIQQRALVVEQKAVTALSVPPRKVPVTSVPVTTDVSARRSHAPSEIDLHGMVVEEALARIDDALDAAMRAGIAEVRFIHGRSGGRIRGALHQRLRAITTVRGFRLDPRNPGVTIVSL